MAPLHSTSARYRSRRFTDCSKANFGNPILYTLGLHGKDFVFFRSQSRYYSCIRSLRDRTGRYLVLGFKPNESTADFINHRPGALRKRELEGHNKGLLACWVGCAKSWHCLWAQKLHAQVFSAPELATVVPLWAWYVAVIQPKAERHWKVHVPIRIPSVTKTTNTATMCKAQCLGHLGNGLMTDTSSANPNLLGL